LLTITKKVKSNLGANIYAQIVGAGYHILMVPLFLTFWSIELYGEWLVLTALPSYISLSNMGLMNVAQNNMTISMAVGDVKAAKRHLDNVWGAQLAISILLFILVLLIVLCVDFTKLFNLSLISSYEANWVFLIFSLFAMLSLQMGIFGAIYRAVGKNARGVLVLNTNRLLSIVAMALALYAGVKSIIGIAVIMCTVFFLGAIFLFIDTAKHAPDLRPGIRYFDIGDIKKVIPDGMAFMAFPFGRAITNQGMLLLVNALMNSSFVVLLATLRTLVNTAFQLSNTISLSTWPVFSEAHGKGDYEGIRRLLTFSSALGFWTGISVAIILWIIGPQLLEWWTRGEVIVGRGLLSIFIIAIVFNATWYSASTIFSANNTHQRLAIIFLVTSCIVPVNSWISFSMLSLGLYSFGIGFLIMEVTMFAMVLPQSLKYIGLTKRAWVAEIISFPLNLLTGRKSHRE
jgi:O-antigen/teichoic acid export membrane protein